MTFAFRDERRQRGRGSPSTAFALGLAVGVAAVIVWAWRGVRQASAVEQPRWDPETARTIATGALLADPELRRFALEVRPIGQDILDVSGIVPTRELAERAIATVRESSGRRTVLDRIHVAGADADGRSGTATARR